MSDQEDDQPRRSGRQRRQPQAYGNSPSKNNRMAVDDEDDGDQDDEDQLSDEEMESEGSEDHVRTTKSSKTKKQSAKKTKRKSAARDDDQDGEELSEDGDGPTAAKKVKKSTGGKRTKKASATGTKSKVGGSKTKAKNGKGKAVLVKDGDMEISDDNGLFNALLNPDTPIVQVLEEWLIAYQATGGEDEEDREEEKRFLAELISFVWRCCGLSNEISPDVADDVDGVPDRIDDVHTELQEAKETPVYPLVSKAKAFKGMAKHLPDFLTTFIDLLGNTPVLYITDSSPPPPSGPTSPLIQLLLTWLNPMTMSQYRAIRHTATFIAMAVGVGICKVAKRTKAVIRSAEKARDQAAGKRAKQKVTKGTKGDAFKAQIKDGKSKLEVLDSYLTDIFDGVFVHRYRDQDATIRADCLTMLGRFMDAYPEHYIATPYLQYVDWALTDQDQHTRLESIKILVPLYSQGDYMSSIRTFTTRAIPRIMEMAVRDVSIPVRVEAIKVLISLDASGFLSDEDEDKREGLGCLLFDRDIKVRKAISGLLKNWYDERVTDMKAQVVEERERQPAGAAGAKGKAVAKKAAKRKPPTKRGRRDEDEEQDEEGGEGVAYDSDGELSEDEPADISDLEDRFVELKVLATMILGFSTRLQRSTDPQGSQGEIGGTQTQQSQKAHDQQVLAALASVTTARDTHATVAAETFWNTDLEAIHDWSSMIEYLAIDHSTSRDEGKAWALEEEQETFFLDMLAVVVAKAVTGGKGKKKTTEEQDEETTAELSQKLVDTLPKFFAKYQSDGVRMVEVLRLASHIDFQSYAEARLVSAYEAMWNDVTRQFLRHTDRVVLREVVALVRRMNSTTALDATNQTKFEELKESLSVALQEALSDKDLAMDSLEDEELQNIESGLLRVQTLMTQYNVDSLFASTGDADQEDDKIDLFDVLLALAARGKLGYRTEVKVVQSAMTILLLHLSWTLRDLSLATVQDDDTIRVRVEKRRDGVARVYEQYAVSSETNAVEAVRREAIGNLLRLHMLFRPISNNPDDAKVAPARQVLALEMDDAVQYRCAGAIQAAIERQTDLAEDGHSESDSSSELTADDDEADGTGNKAAKGKKGEAKPLTPESMIGTAELQDLLWSFIHAMRARVVDPQHAGVMLSQYGRLDGSFDAAMPSLVEILQEEGLYNKDSEMVIHVTAQALQQSFEVYLETACDDKPLKTIELARLLSRAFFTHKAHFKIQRQLNASAISDFHQDGVSWGLTKLSGFLRQEKTSKVKKLKDRFRAKAAGAARYFDVLSLLLPGVEGREALRVKAQLEATLSDLEIKPSKTKFWEPLTHYERRLVSAAATDNKVKAASRKQIEAKEAEVEHEADTEEEEEDDGAMIVVGKPAPKQRRTEADVQQEVDLDENEEVEADVETDVETEIGSAAKKRSREEDGDEDAEVEAQVEGIADAEDEQEETGLAEDRPVKRARRGQD